MNALLDPRLNRRPNPLPGPSRVNPSRSGATRMLFAEEFDIAPGVTIIEAPPEPEIIAPAFTAAEIADAREAAWNEGRAAGIAETETAAAAAARDALAAIASQLGAASREVALLAERAAEEIARLVLGTLTTLLPALCARHGEPEVRAVIRAVLPPLAQEPAVTVRLSPLLAPAVRDEIGRLDPELAERVRLVPTEAMPAGDVRVVWRDGAAVRDTRAVWHEIAAVLSDAGLLMHDPRPTHDDRPMHDNPKESAIGG